MHPGIPDLPAPPRAPSPTEQRPQVLEARQHVLLGVQHLLDGLLHVAVTPPGEHPAAGSPGPAGPAAGQSPHREERARGESGAPGAPGHPARPPPPPPPPRLQPQEGGAGPARRGAGQEGGVDGGIDRPALREAPVGLYGAMRARARMWAGPTSRGRAGHHKGARPTSTLNYNSRDVPRQGTPKKGR